MEHSLYFQKHLFVCLNQRENKQCCAQYGAQNAHRFLKERIKELGLQTEGRIRINQSGCLGRCELGPTLVIYPEGIWYTYVDEEDLNEIIERHLLAGEIVERLLLPASSI